MSMDSFSISLSGLDFERARADAVSRNIANSSNVYRSVTEVYKPIEVVSSAGPLRSVSGVVKPSVMERGDEPQRIYDPSHPYADVNGFVLRAPIDAVQEMVNLMTAVRAYQANVQALEASKKMIQWSIEMGAK